MGLLNEMPISTQLASHITLEQMQDPFKLAEALKQDMITPAHKSRRNFRFPRRLIYGGDSPNSLSKIIPIDERRF